MKAKEFYDEMGGSAQYAEWDLDDPIHSDRDMIEFAEDYAKHQREELIKELEKEFSNERIADMMRVINDFITAVRIRNSIINHLKQKQSVNNETI